MAIQQHRIPQNISSYEFRLVGDMTLKQFGYLASGAIVGLFFYSLPLPTFIKGILISLSGFFGFAFAFLPIEERPLSTWIIAFFRAIFSPTQFVWKKSPSLPEIFEPIPAQPLIYKAPPPDREKVFQYLETLSPTKKYQSLDKAEEEFLQKISGLFPKTTPLKTIPIQPQVFFKETKISSPPQPPQEPKKPASKIPIEAILFPQKPRRKSVKAQTSKTLPIPIQPEKPNIVSGMVLNKNGEIIEGAILEIRNSQGIAVRALKTNKLGQFIIATPLENGVYEIETEKDGFNFDIINIEAKGEIIPPIEIRAK
jgi:hypothetical protein